VSRRRKTGCADEMGVGALDMPCRQLCDGLLFDSMRQFVKATLNVGVQFVRIASVQSRVNVQGYTILAELVVAMSGKLVNKLV
jgi:hypothetical protein